MGGRVVWLKGAFSVNDWKEGLGGGIRRTGTGEGPPLLPLSRDEKEALGAGGAARSLISFNVAEIGTK